MMFSRHVPPAGAPITVRDLLRWIRSLVERNGGVTLSQSISRRFGCKRVFLTSSGRAALTLAFRALQTAAPGRDEVVVPSYTCFSVAAAVVRAGLRVRLVDVDPATVDYEPDSLDKCDFGRVLAMVATNLYGFPSDLPRWHVIARRHGVFLIDDAAQAMGAAVGGGPSGTWGDVGIFSLDKGKNISAIAGGVVVTDSESVAAAIEQQVATLPRLPLLQVLALAVKVAGYAAFLRPTLYGIPNSIPSLGLGTTRFDTQFQLAVMPQPIAALGSVMLDRLGQFSGRRAENALLWQRAIGSIGGLTVLRPLDGAVPAYLRLPVLARDPFNRDRAVRALNAIGIGATASYPTALNDVAELKSHLVEPEANCPGGRTVAARILTLPTHPMVTTEDIDRGAAALAGIRRLPLLALHGPVAW